MRPCYRKQSDTMGIQPVVIEGTCTQYILMREYGPVKAVSFFVHFIFR
jgi:hypothetical protein